MSTKRKRHSNNIISTPIIKVFDKNILRYKNAHPEVFPAIKYIYIAKTYESDLKFKINGIKRRSKSYGIGVLTEKNEYYYSVLYNRQTILTNTLNNKFKDIFLNHYRITPKTRIFYSDNISHKTDPILVFIQIVATSHCLQIKKCNELRMLRHLNNIYKYIKPTKKKGMKIGIWHRNKMIDKLIELNRFDFITDPSWKEKYDLLVRHQQRAFIECAIGMLYQNLLDLDLEYKRTVRENRARRLLEKSIEKESIILKEENNNEKE